MADVYIVVLDVTPDSVRALLFDSEARRVEGYSAQLPRRADASADCLDEMHRLIEAAGFRVGVVMGRAESEVTPEDRKFWPAFESAKWFPSLPSGAGTILGSGCVSPGTLAVVLAENSMVAALVESPLTIDTLTCTPIDEKGWMLSAAVPEAGPAYSSFKQSIKGSVEEFLDNLAVGDPAADRLDSAIQSFRKAYERLLAVCGEALQAIACGSALLQSPALLQRIADGIGVPLTLSTEPEPGCRGAALWALERIGAIANLTTLPASMGALVSPLSLETTK